MSNPYEVTPDTIERIKKQHHYINVNASPLIKIQKISTEQDYSTIWVDLNGNELTGINVPTRFIESNNVVVGGYVSYNNNTLAINYVSKEDFNTNYVQVLDKTNSSDNHSELIMGMHPFGLLQRILHKCDDYAWGWHCNLAMAALDSDAGISLKQANIIATAQMRHMFDVKTELEKDITDNMIRPNPIFSYLVGNRKYYVTDVEDSITCLEDAIKNCTTIPNQKVYINLSHAIGPDSELTDIGSAKHLLSMLQDFYKNNKHLFNK